MAAEREWTTIPCANHDHAGCPGVFREDVVQPWSNHPCACPCHIAEGAPLKTEN